MILDRTGLFSENQAITADAASTNIIDLGATGTPYGSSSALARDIGRGHPIPLLVTVTETFDALTSMVIKMQTDDNSGFSSATDIFVSPTYLLAQLATGLKYLLPDVIPVGAAERYLRLYYDITGSSPTVGKITSCVVADRTQIGLY